MIRGLILALSCAGAAWADTFPAPYAVTDVAANDTLNIRSSPDTNAGIIGEYPPYVLNIEVLRLSHDGEWGLVGVPEGNGWVAMRYLAASDHQDPTAFFRPMSCYGTEPFWSLNVTARGDEYQSMGDPRRDLTLIFERTAPNGALAIFEDGTSSQRTLIVKRGYCTDGMSDREFGWQATLFNDAPGDSAVQSGCCTLDTNF